MYNNIMNKKEIEFPKHSALIAMSNKITAIQRKAFDGLIYLAREQLKTNPINYKYSVSAKTLMGLIGIGEDNYTYLNEFLSKLHDIDVKYNITGKDKKHKWGAFSMLAGYDYEKGIITYSFPHQIQDAIIDPNIYAWIDMVVIKGLKSKYAIALYELAQDYINVGHPITLEFDKFRKLMGVETDKYKNNMSMFKERIINKIVNELNANKKIKFNVSYELLKTGRRYTHIKLFVKRKPIRLQEKQEYANELERQKAGILLAMLPEKERSKSAERLLNKYKNKGKGYIKAQINYTNRVDTKNYLAYLKTALSNDYAGVEKTDIEKSKTIENIGEQEKIAQRAQKREEEEKKKAEEEEIQKLEDYFSNLSENEQGKLKNEVLEKLHEKYPDARSTSAKFGELSVDIGIKKILRERLTAAEST